MFGGVFVRAKFQGRSSATRFIGCSAMGVTTSVMYAAGSPPLSLALPGSESLSAARSAPRPDPAKTQLAVSACLGSLWVRCRSREAFAGARIPQGEPSALVSPDAALARLPRHTATPQTTTIAFSTHISRNGA